MRWLIGAAIGAVLFGGGRVRAVSCDPAAIPGGDGPTPPFSVAAASPLISRIEFAGLRHIAAGAVEAQISSHAGERFDPRRIESDVKALGRLGWFDDVRVEIRPNSIVTRQANEISQSVVVTFVVQERPFLSKVEYSGSTLLSAAQIEKILAEKKLTPRLGAPAAPENLVRISKIIQSTLAELAHPVSQVRIETQTASDGTVGVRFVIDDRRYIRVGRIEFEGDTGVSARILRRQMRRTAPGGMFASWRGEGAYTDEGFEQDRVRLLAYYGNHGFPDARVGTAATEVCEKKENWWLPWKRRRGTERLLVTVPIAAGPFYRIEALRVSPELAEASGKRAAKLLAFSERQLGSAYSAQDTEDLRRAWQTASQAEHSGKVGREFRKVQAFRSFEPQTRSVRMRIGLSDESQYVVRRIEFRGLHRFSDRYVRRRIGLQEGRPFDEHALEEGLTRLSRTGYFRKIKKEDIQVREDNATGTADVTIRIAEAGQQRASFSGGQGQFGSALGVAYSLFDLLQREELLSAQFDAGPDSLQLALGLLMEGFLGSRSSLAFSIFNNVLRPRLTRGVKGPFYRSRSEGFSSTWSYALTTSDSAAVNYSLSRNRTGYAVDLPAGLTSLAAGSVHADTSSGAVGAAWMRDTGKEKISAANSVSGGWLGGSENVLRSNEEYARIFGDPLFSRQNAWAFRATFSGAGSYSGEMPSYARLFSGDAQVRGLREGELGPYAIVPVAPALAGNQTYTAMPAGANVVTAANADYRVPLGNGAQAAAFFDAGAGWMLPNWLGATRPILLTGTNGVLHGAVGVELSWKVPGLEVPVRTYYSVNVLRLDRFSRLPDGTLFHAHNHLFALGWALGNLF